MVILVAQNATYARASGADSMGNVTPGMSLRAIPNRIIMKARE